MNKLKYLLVGSGYRAEFYGRISKTYPGLFKAMFLCRSEAKAASIQEKTGVDAVSSPEKGKQFHPDLIVVAVTKANIADVCAEWAEAGYPVLSETPAGTTPEQLLMLWKLHETKNAKITVCEQYTRYPELTAGLNAVSRGRIGTPHSAFLSLAHDYHAFALLRNMLDTAGESYSVRGESFTTPIVETDSRYGPVTDGRISEKERAVLHIEYSSGKRAVYDFSGVQYHSFIRSRHLTVRGERGEWSDNTLLYLDDDGLPQKECLRPVIPDRYSILDTPGLLSLRAEWHPELRMENAQDEYAIATMLYDMGEHLEGGPNPVPLKDALDDACFWLAARQAVNSPFETVHSLQMPWNNGG